MDRLTVKKGAYGYFLMTLNMSGMPNVNTVAGDYLYTFTAKRTLTQPSPDISLDSTIVPEQFSIKDDNNVLVTLLPANTLNILAGAYSWELKLTAKNIDPATIYITPGTKYGDLLILEKLT